MTHDGYAVVVRPLAEGVGRREALVSRVHGSNRETRTRPAAE